jgi:taurine transport system substrate-binding protein
VIAVASSTVTSDPALVQHYVCAELQGSRDMTGPQAATYLSKTARVQGVPANQVVAATKSYPFIPPSQQLYWLGSTLHDPGSRIVQAYQQTAKFLFTQGRLSSVPSAAQIASHIDISFITKALSGGCTS